MANALEKLGTSGRRAVQLRPEIIHIKPGHNYRDMSKPEVRAHIDWLKESILAIGVQKPIDVSLIDGEVYLEAGECRLTAAQELRKEGWDGWINAFPTTTKDEGKILAQGLLDNGGLVPSKMEFGAAVDRLYGYGWKIEQIVCYVPQHLGLKGAKAKRYVTEAVDLHNAPIGVKKAVREGVDGVKVSEGLALAASKHPMRAAEIIEESVKEAKSKGKTVAKRSKGAGRVTKQKRDLQAFNDQLLELADLLAASVLDDDIPMPQLHKMAKQYQKLRKG